MTLAVRDISAPSAHEWFETRSYRHEQFADLAGLATRKRDLAVSISLVLPTREVAPTLARVLDEWKTAGWTLRLPAGWTAAPDGASWVVTPPQRRK